MKIQPTIMLILSFALAGCVTGYTLVQPGVNAAGKLQVTASRGWNLAPPAATPAARRGSQTWTRDGIFLDRIVLIPGVAEGETLLKDKSGSAALPTFRKDMLPNELEELVASTLVKYFGEGNSTVSTANLRPQTFGGQQGVMFDINVKVTDSPDYKGTVGAFVAEQKFYTLWYIAADPYYYSKHSAVGDRIIKSAILVR